MGITIDTWIGLLQFLLGGAFASLVWLFRLEGRVNVLISRADGTEKRIDGLEAQIIGHLTRIEGQLYNLLQRDGGK